MYAEQNFQTSISPAETDGSHAVSHKSVHTRPELGVILARNLVLWGSTLVTLAILYTVFSLF
jgi:hypothetical protein